MSGSAEKILQKTIFNLNYYLTYVPLHFNITYE